MFVYVKAGEAPDADYILSYPATGTSGGTWQRQIKKSEAINVLWADGVKGNAVIDLPVILSVADDGGLVLTAPSANFTAEDTGKTAVLSHSNFDADSGLYSDFVAPVIYCSPTTLKLNSAMGIMPAPFQITEIRSCPGSHQVKTAGLSNLANNTTYYYTVVPLDDNLQPLAVSIVRAITTHASGNTLVKLGWAVNNKNASAYDIFRSPLADDITNAQPYYRVGGPAVTFTDTGNVPDGMKPVTTLMLNYGNDDTDGIQNVLNLIKAGNAGYDVLFPAFFTFLITKSLSAGPDAQGIGGRMVYAYGAALAGSNLMPLLHMSNCSGVSVIGGWWLCPVAMPKLSIKAGSDAEEEPNTNEAQACIRFDDCQNITVQDVHIKSRGGGIMFNSCTGVKAINNIIEVINGEAGYNED